MQSGRGVSSHRRELRDPCVGILLELVKAVLRSGETTNRIISILEDWRFRLLGLGYSGIVGAEVLVLVVMTSLWGGAAV